MNGKGYNLFFITSLFLIVLSSFAYAEYVPSMAQGLQSWIPQPLRNSWQNITGKAGGEGFQAIKDIDWCEGNQSRIYIGTDTVRVWRSDDAGDSWFVTDRKVQPEGANSISCDPKNSDVVYADFGYGSIAGSLEGIYRSIDGGLNWTLILGTLNTTHNTHGKTILIDNLTYSTNYSQTIYVGSYVNGNGSILKSTNGGDSWSFVGFGNATLIYVMSWANSQHTAMYVGTNYSSLYYVNLSTNVVSTLSSAFSSQIRDIAVANNYTSLWMTQNTGLNVSHNSGTTISTANSGLTTPYNYYRISISPVNNSILWASVDSTGGNKPQYSWDGGATWGSTLYGGDANPEFLTNGWYYAKVVEPNPFNQSEAITQLASAIGKTHDKGYNWNFSGNGYSGWRMQDIWFINTTARYECGIDFGVFKTYNDGQTYTNMNLTTSGGSRSCMAIDGINESYIFAGSGDWGDQDLFMWNGTAWRNVVNTTDTISFIRINRSNTKYIFVNDMFSNNSGVNWYNDTGLTTTYKAIGFDPNNDGIIYALNKSESGTEYIYRSNLSGLPGSWYRFSDSFSSTSPERFLCVSPWNDGYLIAPRESAGVRIYDGSSWTTYSASAGLLSGDNANYRYCAFDRKVPGKMYVAKEGYQYHSTGISQSDDYGVTWHNITSNIGPYNNIFAIEVNPFNNKIYITGESLFYLNNSWYPKTYYISQSTGNDIYDGLMPSTAIKTIRAGNTNLTLYPGDNFLFCRGNMWRLTSDAFPKITYFGNSSGNITYGAYGIGSKPLLIASFNLSNSSLWYEEFANKWRIINATDNGINLFNNPSFDSTANNMTAYFGSPAAGYCVRNTTEYYSAPASYGCFIQGNGSSGSSIQLYTTEDVVLEDSTRYEITFYAKSNATGRFSSENTIELVNRTGGYTDLYDTYTNSSLLINNSWNKYSVMYHTITNASKYTQWRINFAIGNSFPNNTFLYLDNISIKKMTIDIPFGQNDIGEFLFNGESFWGNKTYSVSQLLKQGDWFYDMDRKLYLYSTSNPGLYYNNIEAFSSNTHASDVATFEVRASNIVIRDLDVRYNAIHGISSSNNNFVYLINNSISWMGGADTYNPDDWVRYGNCQQFGEAGSNLLVEYNNLSYCYDAGLTSQAWTDNAARNMYNHTYRYNLISKSYEGFEYFSSNITRSITQNIIVENNTYFDMGYGWNHVGIGTYTSKGERWARTPMNANTSGLRSANNIFYNFSNKSGSIYYRDIGQGVAGWWVTPLPNISNDIFYPALNANIKMRLNLTTYTSLSTLKSAGFESGSNEINPNFVDMNRLIPTSYTACTMSNTGTYVGAIPCTCTNLTENRLFNNQLNYGDICTGEYRFNDTEKNGVVVVNTSQPVDFKNIILIGNNTNNSLAVYINVTNYTVYNLLMNNYSTSLLYNGSGINQISNTSNISLLNYSYNSNLTVNYSGGDQINLSGMSSLVSSSGTYAIERSGTVLGNSDLNTYSILSGYNWRFYPIITGSTLTGGESGTGGGGGYTSSTNTVYEIYPGTISFTIKPNEKITKSFTIVNKDSSTLKIIPSSQIMTEGEIDLQSGGSKTYFFTIVGNKNSIQNHETIQLTISKGASYQKIENINVYWNVTNYIDNGKSCYANEECVSGVCENGVCSGEIPKTTDILDDIKNTINDFISGNKSTVKIVLAGLIVALVIYLIVTSRKKNYK